MTPHELNLHIMENNEKNKQEQQQQLLVAYVGERLHRKKRLPDFDKLFEQEQPEKEQTAEDMLVHIKKLNATLGGTTI